MSKFKDGVIKVVNLIPYGKIVSYGQVALYLGLPRAARQVGWVLNGLEDHTPLPWWRVVNNQGRISIKGSKHSAEQQRQLLLQEGIEVSDDLTFEIERYRFIADGEFINKTRLDSSYLEMVSASLPYSRYFKKGL